VTPNDDGRAPDATASMTDVNARERAAGAADGWTRAVPRAAAWQDPLLGLALAVASVMTDPDVLDGSTRLWTTVVWSALLGAPLAVRRRYPVITGTLVVAVFLGMQITEVGDRLVSQVAVVVALYTIGAWGRDRDVARVATTAVTALALVWMVVGLVARADDLAASVDGVPLPTLVGETSWRSAHRLAQLEARTRQLAEEQVRSERAAVAIEKMRIARELHDVVAHHISIVGVHAGAARLAAGPDAPASPALARIEDSARDAVDELHGLLTTLREDDGAAEDLAPASLGVDLLPALVADARSADGGEVLRVDGTPRPLRPTVEATVVRIAQEALTNVRKHAGPGAQVAVTLRYEPDRVALLVESTLEASGDRVSGPGPGTSASLPATTGTATGLGHVGMRERAAAVGGTVQAGPTAAGDRIASGYSVRLEVPA
jgi:signal transduction histidine kinase